MIRDHLTAFLGSQTLRAIEFDARWEVGLIFREPNAGSQNPPDLRRGLGPGASV